MSTTELSAPPALGGLYLRALRGGRGDALPGRRLLVAGVEIDREHVAAYDAVCGFRLTDALPPTYLHVLAFPLAMALMTARDFPFRAVGLVHVENRIEQRRELTPAERPSLETWAEQLRPHRRGRRFDVVTEARVGGEVVWSERSTYLRREQAPGGADPAERAEEDEPPRAVRAWIEAPKAIGRRYAAVSGDRNPIHVSGAAARLFGMPGTIAHGMWMKARCLAALEGELPGACFAQVSFRAPLRLPGKAGLAEERRGEDVSFALRGRDGDRVHLTGRAGPIR
jgi:acyl dehydratase